MGKNIISFSGGKDSTAMLHMMLERGEEIAEVIFFDTGWEFDVMYEHIAKVESKTGLKVTRLKPEKPFDYWFSEHAYVSRKFRNVQHQGYAWPGVKSRWCTRQKMDTIDRYKKTLTYDHECIGIAVGEERRVRHGNKKRYPLLEYGVTEREALIFCKKIGYDWGGLYEIFDRVSCFCCTLQRRIDFINLRKFCPREWAKIEEMAARCPERLFRDKMTFEDYEKIVMNREDENGLI